MHWKKLIKLIAKGFLNFDLLELVKVTKVWLKLIFVLLRRLSVIVRCGRRLR